MNLGTLLGVEVVGNVYERLSILRFDYTEGEIVVTELLFKIFFIFLYFDISFDLVELVTTIK